MGVIIRYSALYIICIMYYILFIIIEVLSMKNFGVTLKIPMKAVCEESVENWLDNFVIPDLVARWSDGGMMIETEIKEINR